MKDQWSYLFLLRTPALADLNRKALVVVGITSSAMNILLFAMPLYSLQVYDRVMVSRSSETLLLLTLIVVLALTANSVLDAVRGRLLLRIGNAYSLQLGPRLLEAAITRSARESQPDGQVLRHLNTVRGFVASPQGLATLFDAPLVIFFLAAVYMMHSALGHAMLFGVLVLLLLTALTEALTGSPLRASSEASILAQRRIDDAMHNAEAIEAMGMRAAMRKYWFDVQSHAMGAASMASDRSSSVSAMAKWVRMILNLLITGVGAWYVIHDEITIGTMVAANVLSARGLAPLETMIGAWKGLVGARIAVGRINQMLEHPTSHEGTMKLPRPTGAVRLERVVYVPPGQEHATVKGISFDVPAASWLGVVGPSGAGKSTLGKLLSGVWVPRSGAVRLDGADVGSWPRTDFGKHCGYLPQDVELFAGSVRDNIARFQSPEEADDAAVVAAARMAGVHELILKLPKGYESQIGSGGTALSAGQRQRIGLARALLGLPRLLILDEPNSNLDADGETALIEALRSARAGGATVIVISHRPSLLVDANLVAVVIDGQLQHFGARDEVLAKIVPKARPALMEVSRGTA
jgi:PrtD family type I secretion system ABC transporter